MQTRESYEANQQIAKEFFADRSWVPAELPLDGWDYGGKVGNIRAQSIHEYVSLMLGEEFMLERNILSKSLPPEVVQSGFRVIGIGIGYCDDAYRKYCADTGQTPNPEDLVAALKSPQTIRFFTMAAGMMNDKNRELETWFGLRGYNNQATEPFIYDPVELCFNPNPELMQTAKLAVIRWALNNEQSPKMSDPAPNRCPALPWIPEAWNIVVEACEQATLLDPVNCVYQ